MTARLPFSLLSLSFLLLGRSFLVQLIRELGTIKPLLMHPESVTQIDAVDVVVERGQHLVVVSLDLRSLLVQDYRLVRHRKRLKFGRSQSLILFLLFDFLLLLLLDLEQNMLVRDFLFFLLFLPICRVECGL